MALRKRGADTQTTPQHPGMGQAPSGGAGGRFDAPNHLMLQKKKKRSTKPNAELKGKAKQRRGGEAGTEQGQRCPCVGCECGFEGMLEGHKPPSIAALRGQKISPEKQLRMRRQQLHLTPLANSLQTSTPSAQMPIFAAAQKQLIFKGNKPKAAPRTKHRPASPPPPSPGLRLDVEQSAKIAKSV